MSDLIADLALILICAGVMTLIFKKLKQPLVLGYIVAGFLASPHFSFLPSVTDGASVHVWADIGVIFLLFALGLEFSIKKILKVGGPAIIAALTIIIGMIFLGFTVGKASGWSKMDSIFLGGMIAMSSTTIIYKAFDDLGLRHQKFTGLVLSILILEDILAVVLMVLLSTMAVSNSVEGGEMLRSILKLAFFLVLWFVVGLFVIPLILKHTRRLMNDETLLVVALGLCFGMVVIAAKTGFSAAFGAFIMGSILAETVEAEHIDHLVKPVKDLFGAIFFVSVGMMVDPAMIAAYWLPILIITLTVLFGQATFATLGVLLSGQPLKTALQCGFSLTQIGEFAFIIASLGVSLGVTSNFLYPVVVAVSVITIFLTPYMIRLADPVYRWLDRKLPEKTRAFLNRYNTGSAMVGADSSDWKKYLLDILKTTVVNLILVVAIIALSYRYLVPAILGIPGVWGRILAAAGVILLISPFLRSMMIHGLRSMPFMRLWHENRVNRAPLVASVVIRILIGMAFVVAVLGHFFHFSVFLVSVLALTLVTLMLTNRFLHRQSKRIEETFNANMRAREEKAKAAEPKRSAIESRLLSKDLHLADFDLPGDTPLAGKTLMELGFGKKYGVHVVSIHRGDVRIRIPSAHDCLYPQDRIRVIGNDAELEAFAAALEGHHAHTAAAPDADGEVILSLVKIRATSPFLGQTVRDAGFRANYHCLIAGVEGPDGALHVPDASVPFAEGDILWVVGAKPDVDRISSL